MERMSQKFIITLRDQFDFKVIFPAIFWLNLSSIVVTEKNWGDGNTNALGPVSPFVCLQIVVIKIVVLPFV